MVLRCSCIVFFEIVMFLVVNRTPKYSATSTASAGGHGYATHSAFLAVDPVTSDSCSDSDHGCSSSDASASRRSDSTAHVCPTANSYTASGISALTTAAAVPGSSVDTTARNKTHGAAGTKTLTANGIPWVLVSLASLL